MQHKNFDASGENVLTRFITCDNMLAGGEPRRKSCEPRGGILMRRDKERTTVNFDADVYQKVLELRAKPEYARMSISAIVNVLLERALAEKRADQTA